MNIPLLFDMLSKHGFVIRNLLSLVISIKWACSPFFLSHRDIFFHALYYYCGFEL